MVSIDWNEVVQVVQGSSVGGVVCDFVAVGEQGVKAFVKKFTNIRLGGIGNA